MVEGFLSFKGLMLFSADAFLIIAIVLILILVLKFMTVKSHKESINLMLKFGVYIYMLYIFSLFSIISNSFPLLVLKKTVWLSFNDLYNVNLFLVFFKILIAFLFVLIYFIGLHFFEYQKKTNVEYIYFLIFLPLSLILLLNSTDLIYMYINIELSSLLIYILIISKKYSNYSSEASLKYFILSGISSCFLLFGVGLFYGVTGTTDLLELNKLFLNLNVYNEYSLGFSMASLFILFGFLFKLGIFPFHVWVPDVYQGTSIFFTMILTTVPKLAILIVFCKLNVYMLAKFAFFMNKIWLVCSLGCLFIGVFGSFFQTNIKRLWAYSAIAHMGFLLSNFVNLTNLSIFSSLFYFVIYIIVSLNFFMILMLFIKSRSHFFLENIKQLGLLSRCYRPYGYAISFLLFSFIGIPPLAGFFTKLVVFQNLSNSSEYILLLFILFFTVLSAFYYLRLIRKIFFKKSINGILFVKIGRLYTLLLVNLLAFNLLFLFLLPMFTFYLNFILLYWI